MIFSQTAFAPPISAMPGPPDGLYKVRWSTQGHPTMVPGGGETFDALVCSARDVQAMSFRHHPDFLHVFDSMGWWCGVGREDLMWTSVLRIVGPLTEANAEIVFRGIQARYVLGARKWALWGPKGGVAAEVRKDIERPFVLRKAGLLDAVTPKPVASPALPHRRSTIQAQATPIAPSARPAIVETPTPPPRPPARPSAARLPEPPKRDMRRVEIWDRDLLRFRPALVPPDSEPPRASEICLESALPPIGSTAERAGRSIVFVAHGKPFRLRASDLGEAGAHLLPHLGQMVRRCYWRLA